MYRPIDIYMLWSAVSDLKECTGIWPRLTCILHCMRFLWSSQCAFSLAFAISTDFFCYCHFFLYYFRIFIHFVVESIWFTHVTAACFAKLLWIVLLVIFCLVVLIDFLKVHFYYKSNVYFTFCVLPCACFMVGDLMCRCIFVSYLSSLQAWWNNEREIKQ